MQAGSTVAGLCATCLSLLLESTDFSGKGGMHVGIADVDLNQLAHADRKVTILGHSRMPSSKNALMWQPQL